MFVAIMPQRTIDQPNKLSLSTFVSPMVSAIDKAKRVLVTLLKSLAAIYGVALGLTRECTQVEVKAAYKKVSCKAHPDRGGAPEHQKALNAARDAWEETLRASKGRGGDRTAKKTHRPARERFTVKKETALEIRQHSKRDGADLQGRDSQWKRKTILICKEETNTCEDENRREEEESARD